MGHDRTEDVIQGIEDKIQDEERDPKGQDDQDSCKYLCPKVFENILYHSLHAESWRIFFRSASSTTSFSSKRRASSPNSPFLAMRISFAL